MDETRRGSLLGPVLLIAAGVVFLLNNLGVLDWGIWRSLLNLWPILLIAAGLDIMLGRRSMLGSLVVTVVVVVLLAGGVWWMASQTASLGSARTQAIDQPLQGASSAEVSLVVGAGSVRLGPLAEGEQLIAGTVRVQERQRLQESAQGSNDRLRYELRSSGRRFAPPFGGLADEEWDLSLNRDIPIDLSVSTGVGRATLDLERLHLTSLHLNTGVGESAVTLPHSGRLRVEIKGGIGSLRVRIPQGMAARIDASSGLGQVNVRGDFSRNGNVYQSPGYDNAVDRLDMDISGGIGSITIESVRGE